MKKAGLALSFAVLFTLSCAADHRPAGNSDKDAQLRHKYRGVESVILRLDAATPKHGITITSETGSRVASPGTLRLNKVDHRDFSTYRGPLPIPKSIRVTWRQGEYRYMDHGGWTGGTVLGDYTVPVAERIPDDVLDYVRNHTAALRLKIRLKDDGVLIGWDVEDWYAVAGGRTFRHVLAGGDFREDKIFNGKVIEPGWQK